jgi:hypothetical protein
MAIKRTLTYLSILITNVVSAQIEKGTISPAGLIDLSYNVNSKTSSQTFVVGFSPDVSFFVAKNLGIGPVFGYNFSSNKFGGAITSRNHNFLLGPALRYYYPFSEKVSLATVGEFTYFLRREFFGQNDPFFNRSGIAWRAGVGLAVFPIKSIAIELLANYRGQYYRNSIVNNGNILGTPTPETIQGFYFGAGFRVFIPKRVLKTSLPIQN